MACNKSEASDIKCSIRGILWMHIHWYVLRPADDLDVSWHSLFCFLMVLPEGVSPLQPEQMQLSGAVNH